MASKEIRTIAQPMDEFWVEPLDAGLTEPQLVIDIDGFEGPLDLLLHLSRDQKVDLTRISIVALVDQYLAFIQEAQRLRLELAADYLVMAAWLAYLKSRLLIPKKSDDDEPSGEGLAELLQFRLRRLEAMREKALELMQRNQLGRQFFKRGLPEMAIVEKKHLYSTTLYELLMAYASIRQKNSIKQVEFVQRKVWSLKAARELLQRLLGKAQDWVSLDEYLLSYINSPDEERTARASLFATSLEMVREGSVELRQSQPFAPIYVRANVTRSANRGNQDE